MALNDIVRNVITKYKADTTDHKKAITDLRDETKKLADENKKSHETFEKFMGTATKITGAIAGAKLVFESYNHAIKDARLSTAAMGVDIDKLSTAAGGMKTRMQLLQDAAKFNSSAFKLSSEQMATAERAMRAFTRAGFDQEEATQKVTDAIVKLEADGLKDFGVRVRSATTDADKFNAIMESLAQVGGKVRDGQLSAAEGAQAASIKLQDSWDKLKTGLGEVAIAFSPVIEALATVVGLAGDIAKYAGAGAGKVFGRADGLLESWVPDTGADFRAKARATYQSGFDSARTPLRSGGGMIDLSDSTVIKTIHASFLQARAEYIEKNREKWKAMAEAQIEAAAHREAIEILGAATGGNAGNFDVGATSSSLGEISGSQWDRWMADSEILNRDLGALRGAGSTNAEWQQSARSKSRLEEMFGPVDEINGFTVAFQGLQGAVTAAMDAWITGSMGAGEAMKKFSGEFLKSLSTMLMTESLKHTAYAIASAIPGPTFNPAGIGGHAAAAAAFAGAALLAGAGAKALHSGGGASGGAGAGSAAPTYNAGAGSVPAEKHTTIVVGSAFLPEGSPRQRQLAASKIVETALGAGGVTYAS